MKYMLMMHAPRAGWETAGIGTWPPEDIKAHIGFMLRFNKELREAGELVGAEGLAGPEQARIVRANKAGAPEVTDGPYPGGQGVPRGLLDRGRRHDRARVRDRGTRVRGTRQGRRAAQHADRDP